MEIVFLRHMSQYSSHHEGVAILRTLLPACCNALLHQPVHQSRTSEDGCVIPEYIPAYMGVLQHSESETVIWTVAVANGGPKLERHLLKITSTQCKVSTMSGHG